MSHSMTLGSSMVPENDASTVLKQISRSKEGLPDSQKTVP